MVLGNKGQIVFVYIMVAVIVLIMGIAFTKPLKDEIGAATNTSLNCTLPNKSPELTATCSIMDLGFFYVISTCIALGLSLLSGKKTITGVLSSIMVFMVTIILISPLKGLITLMRDSQHLNCASTAIVGVKLTCIFVDLWLFYFVVLAIAAGISYIYSKAVKK